MRKGGKAKPRNSIIAQWLPIYRLKFRLLSGQ